MSKIKAIYPDSWLTVTFNVWNDTTWLVDFTWPWVEVDNTWAYIFSFTEVAMTDYTWIASSTWYSDVKWSLFASTTIGWSGASVADIWTAQISDYDSTPWSFANKFAQYGGVSHVIDRSTFDEESKKRLDALIKALEEKKEVVTNAFDETKIDKIISSIQDIKNLPIKKDTDIAVLRGLIASIPKPEAVDNSFSEEMLVEWLPAMMDDINNIYKILKEKEEVSSAIESTLIEEIDRKNAEIDRLLIENKKLKNLI